MINNRPSKIWNFTYYWKGQDRTETRYEQIRIINELKDQKNDSVSACVFQEETCPSTGRLHLQGMVRFKKSHRLSGAQSAAFGDNTVHMEVPVHQQESYEYCKKLESRVPNTEWVCDFGKCVNGQQGERNDLKRAIEVLFAADGGMVALAEEHAAVYVRCHRGLHALWNIRKPAIAVDRKVIVHWGPPGVGKTYNVYHAEGATVFNVSHPGEDGRLWFDGYTGQNTILFDDFYGWIKYTRWLMYCDENPIMLPVKGGFIPCQADKIVFTSNQHPKHWYKCDEVRIFKYAIQRRIDTIIHYKSRHFRATQQWGPLHNEDQESHQEIDLCDSSQEMATLLTQGESRSENYNK